MTKFKLLSNILIISLFFSRCTSPQEVEIAKKNHVVILDLSDRIFDSKQVDRDIKDILKLREQFLAITEEELKENGICSENNFIINIAYQKGNPDFTEDLNLLKIDLQGKNESGDWGNLIGTNKNISENEYKNLLIKLYQKAKKGKTNKDDFNGTDFSNYFNQEFKNSLNKEDENYCFIITDGLLYFESDKNEKALNPNLTFNDMEELKSASGINKQGWEEIYDSKGLGMRNLNENFKDYKCKLFILEISPEDLPNHTDFIKKVWVDWLATAGLKIEKDDFFSNKSGNDIVGIISGKLKISASTNNKAQEEKKETEKENVLIKKKKPFKIIENNLSSNIQVKKSLKNKPEPKSLDEKNDFKADYLKELISSINKCTNIEEQSKRVNNELLIIKTDLIKLQKTDCIKLLNKTLENLKIIIPNNKKNEDYTIYCNLVGEIEFKLKKIGVMPNQKLISELKNIYLLKN